MIQRNIAAYLLPLILLAHLTGCEHPVPENKQAYVGQWNSPEMELLITQDGGVYYKRRAQGGTVTLDGPIKEFVGDDFVVGIPVFNTTFKVQKTPYRENGTWKMQVDGVVLTRQ